MATVPAAGTPIRKPEPPPAAATLEAVRAATAGRPDVAGVYVFDQRDERAGWQLCVGVHLVPGAVAAAVMPEIDSAVRMRLPEGPTLRLLALSRRRVAGVRRAVAPL